MNNLEKIKKAWAIGWSAILTNGSRIFQVVSIFDNGMCLRSEKGGLNNAVIERSNDFIEKYKITGYKYAGELAGNEPIPKKQLFKVKSSGEIGVYSHRNSLYNLMFEKECKQYHPSEIEPVFE